MYEKLVTIHNKAKNRTEETGEKNMLLKYGM